MIQKLLIVDDESRIREALKALLFNYDKSILCDEAAGVHEAIEKLGQTNYDVLLLDIQLQDGTGFDVLTKIQGNPVKIIFITAYEDFAIRAFRSSAIDYLLKPVNPAELKSALNKASKAVEKDQLETRLNVLVSNISQSVKSARKLVLNTQDKLYVVQLSEVIRLQAEQNYTHFFLAGGNQILVSKTLKEYDDLLSKDGFIRVHQSHLINPDYISRYEKKDNGSLVMKDNSVIPVSVRKKEELMDLLNSL